MGGSDPDQQPDESPKASSANPERWVDEHGDCLYRYALVRVRVPEVAEDLVQETLLAAVRSREKFGGRSSERSWLVGILKNKTRNAPHHQGLEFLLVILLLEQLRQHSEDVEPDGFIGCIGSDRRQALRYPGQALSAASGRRIHFWQWLRASSISIKRFGHSMPNEKKLVGSTSPSYGPFSV